jgi:beta-aspartyl-peptidase (threonine type)
MPITAETLSKIGLVMSPAIIVHGGAGPTTPRLLEKKLAGCVEAAVRGWDILHNGGTGLDAVEASVVALEDNPLFNAGRGSTLTALGHVEMDAAVMCSDSRVGAVAAVCCIKNPIRLARRVMEDGRHVLLVGKGAQAFGHENGIEECPEEYLVTEQQRRWWRSQGTVGCVAMDQSGQIFAGTSTGGRRGQLDGRVGDSPLPGCGTFANEHGAASCTGVGEAIIRVLMAKSALDFLAAGFDAATAAQASIDLMAQRTGSEAGLILIDASGAIAHARNTEEMPVCSIAGDGKPVTAA